MAAETVNKISGRVSDAAVKEIVNGEQVDKAIVGATVLVSDLAGEKIGEAKTGDTGWYWFDLDEPMLIERDAYGRLLVDVRVTRNQSRLFGPRQVAGKLVLLAQAEQVPELRVDVTLNKPRGGQRPPPDPVSDRLDQLADVVSLLPTFSEGGRMARSTSESPRPTSSLDEWIDAELSETLGQAFGTTDLDATTLDQLLREAVETSDENGHRVYKFKSTASIPHTEPHEPAGIIAGAQRSLVFQVEDATDRMRALLRRIKPVGGGQDLERADAARAAVDESLERLKQETQRSGGPIVPRIDSLFTTLTSQVVNLKREFGLDGDQPLLPSQEEDITNIFAVEDTIVGLQAAWANFRTPRVSEGRLRSFIGSQLIVLDRVLRAVYEQVDETERALNAVGIGSAERRAKVLEWFPEDAEEQASTVPIPVLIPLGDLLDWIRTLAGEDAPDLLKKSGRLGAKAIRFQAEDIQEVVRAAITQLPYRRVTTTLVALDDQLDTVIEQAGQLEPTDALANESRT
jgi:hypothetical protein